MGRNLLILLISTLIYSIECQQVQTNIPFECRGRTDGFWRDLRYCDVFHGCVAGVQKISYSCPQVGERFFFDDTTQRCESASGNTGGCSSNQYYSPITNPLPPSGQLTTLAPSEPWRIFAQSREQFSCANKPDGFYASRWCNVFYRCTGSVSNAFLCPAQRSGARLWWIQHGSSQGISDEPSATCTYPCDTGRRCTSAGGVIVDNGNQISESQQDAETAYRLSPCSNQTSQGGSSVGGFQPGSGVGQPSSGGVSIGTGTIRPGTGSSGISQPGSGQTGIGQTGGGNQGSSFGTGGSFTIDSDVSCSDQADNVLLPSRYCNVFHQCLSGSRFDVRCARANDVPYDLWFNPQTNLCDWPCRVQCNNPIYASSMSAQQIRSDSLAFFNNDCRAYPLIFNTNK